MFSSMFILILQLIFIILETWNAPIFLEWSYFPFLRELLFCKMTKQINLIKGYWSDCLILCFLSYINTYSKSCHIPKFELHCSIGSHVRSKSPFSIFPLNCTQTALWLPNLCHFIVNISVIVANLMFKFQYVDQKNTLFHMV